MNYLAIDTSGAYLTVVIEWQGKTYKYFDKDCGVKHSVSLMTEVENLARTADFDFTKADFFACVVGAGSFTGIRIAVSTVKALCFAYGKPCLPITSFDTIAYNKTKGEVFAVIDAGHGGYYACGYSDKKVVFEPSYILLNDLLPLIKGKRVLSFGKISDLKSESVDVVKGLILAVRDKGGNTLSPEELNPLYIRKSQAEEGR